MSELIRAIEYRELQAEKAAVEQREQEADTLVRTIIEEQDGVAADLEEFIFAVHAILPSKPPVDEASGKILQTYKTIEPFFDAVDKPIARYDLPRFTRLRNAPLWIGQIAADPLLQVEPARDHSRPVRGSIYLTAKNVHTSEEMTEVSPAYRANAGKFDDPRSFVTLDSIRTELTRGGRDTDLFSNRVIQVHTPNDLDSYVIGWSEIMKRYDCYDSPNQDTVRFLARISTTMQDFGVSEYSDWDYVTGRLPAAYR